MNANRKIILFIALGVGACLLSFSISRLFQEKDRTNQAMLANIQQALPHLEHVQLLTAAFIQNTEPKTWEKINDEIRLIGRHFDPANFENSIWKSEVAELNRNLDDYNLHLTHLYAPVVRLHTQKMALQGIGLSFIQEVEEGIVIPFREEEGLRLFAGEPLDPLKSRVKDTVYDLVALYNKQQLILLELLLSSDLDRYQLEKRKLSEALAQRETQLHYISVLVGDEEGISATIASLERKIGDLAQTEQAIVEHFIELSKISGQIEAAGTTLIIGSQKLSKTIMDDTRASSKLYGLMSWGLLAGLLVCLSLLGAWLGRDIITFVRDLGRAKEELQESERNLRVTLYSIGDAVIATDASGVITSINPSAEQLTGWEQKDAVGRPLKKVFRIIHAHTRAPIVNPVEKILDREEVAGLADHTVLVSKTGREYRIAFSGAPIRLDDGGTVGVVLVFRDVTESYANEQKIRDSERLLKNLTANVPGVVYQFSATPDTGLLTPHFISPNAAEIFGIDVPDEEFYDAFVNRLPPHEAEDFGLSVVEAISKAIPWSWTGRFIKPSGERIWFSAEAVPQREGDRIIYYGVLLDVTEQKQWEQALKASEERYKRLFNEAPMMYVLNDDRDGIPHIRDVNNMFLELLGYDRQEVLGAPLQNFYSEESKRLMLEGGYERARQGELIVAERDLIARDGRTINTLLHIRPEFGGDSQAIGTRAMYLDITQHKLAQQEAKRLESALAQARKMEAIGTLAGGIAHDFNNILSAVIGYAELIIAKVGEDSPLYDNLQQIFRAGLRAKELVEQILAFSRQSERELKPLQAGPLVKETLKLLRSSLPSTIEIIQRIQEDLDSIMADPTQIHQIVMNLCTNAAHAMEEKGGAMTVTLSEVILNEQDVRLYPGLSSGEYVELVVQDTGRGIAPEIREHIFDPYFTTKDKGKGTGLGLSIVHGIVQNYGGAIHAYSEMGQGAAFKVYIPVVKQFQPHEEIQPSEPPRGNESILLVDDEEALTEVGQRTLELLGYHVQVANSAPEALEIFQADPQSFDLVISDMTMPKMTGDQLASALLKIRKDLSIILCTGFSTKISRERAQEIGARALVMKPFVTRDLALVIRKVLDGPGAESARQIRAS